MIKENFFSLALSIVLEYEGGGITHKHEKDPGGLTKWGISKKAYPHLDIQNLTLDQASDIYFDDYWEPIWADKLPIGVALCMFDTAVNMGLSSSVKMIQRVVGVDDDGIMGPITCNSIRARAKRSEQELIKDFIAQRVIEYNKRIKRNDDLEVFQRGWFRRSIDVCLKADKLKDF